MEPGPTTPRPAEERKQSRTPGSGATERLDLEGCVDELLAIVDYVAAADGPLRMPPGEAAASPWHRRLLLKAMERLDVIDGFMRGRVAFLVAGRERGYHAPQEELDLAGSALDTCRAAHVVTEELLAARVPPPQQSAMMGEAALRVRAALATTGEARPPQDES
ncbi:MAG TPA: hypothetical protein PLB39_05105 [Thermoleophilia bacterium]|nr:hypothetical protein [Thermoleophilia bacterium]